MFYCAENGRLLSNFRCGCHGLHADTGRWVGTARLCQVSHSLQDVEDEQHFIVDCPVKLGKANLLQQTCTVPGFTAQCEPNACSGVSRECYSCRKCVLSN